MKSSLAYYVMILRNNFVEFCNEELKKIGLSQGLLFFILYIGNHKGCSPKEVAHALNMDMGHVTRSISKLVEGEFITRVENPNDRRAHILELKEKGQDSYRISHELFDIWDTRVMKDLNLSDKNNVLDILHNIAYKKGEQHNV